MGIKVKPRHNESIDRTLKRFRKLLQREGVLRDVIRHRYYEPKRVRRRRTRWKNNSRNARK